MQPLIEWTPIEGINREDASIAVRNTQALTSSNFLYERGVARVRPAAVRANYSFWPDPGSAKFQYSKGVMVDADNPNSVVVLDDGSLGKGPQAQDITGPAITLGSAEFDNISVVNGLFIIGNNGTGGLIRHDPSTSAYTVVAAASYRYFTGFFSRAVGAHGGGGTLAPRRVAWSVAGDETDWAGEGSGATVLAETPDEITGIKNIKNTLAILRGAGITLGYPTGVGTAAIRFETAVRDGRSGCPYPSTIAQDDDQLYYLGQDDVYTYDLNGALPVGRDIRRDVLFWAARGVLFRGIVTRMDLGVGPGLSPTTTTSTTGFDPKPRLRYHLVPITKSEIAPHFCLDVEQKAWSRHRYRQKIIGAVEGFNLVSPGADTATSWNLMLLLDEATRDVLFWTDQSSGVNESDDEDATIESGVLTVGDPGTEYQVSRLLIVWALDGLYGEAPLEAPNITVGIRCRQRHKAVARETTIDLFGLKEGEEGWQVTWADLRISGQFFQVRIDVPAALKIQIKSVVLYGTEFAQSKAGQFK